MDQPSGPRSALLVSLVLGACAVWACSSAKTEPEAGGITDDPIPAVTAPPPATSEPTAEPTATASAPEPKGPSDREITGRECEALGQKYKELTKSDQMAALKPGLTEAQREQGRAAIDKAADKLSTRWVESCMSSLVGKVASEDALKCAMSSKSVAAFDVCLNGPSTPPP